VAPITAPRTRASTRMLLLAVRVAWWRTNAGALWAASQLTYSLVEAVALRVAFYTGLSIGGRAVGIGNGLIGGAEQRYWVSL